MKHCIFSILAAAMLAACGGTAAPSADSPQTVARQAAPPSSIKQQASNYANTVQMLYLAYFGRPADPDGLANVEAVLQTANAPTQIGLLAQAYEADAAIKSLIDSFGTSKESEGLYNGDTASFVTAVFQNVIGRAPQADGLSFWVGAIDGGTLSRGDAALSIMAGALENVTLQGAIDSQLISNRLTVAAGFTAAISNLHAASYYAGQPAAASARSMLAGVTTSTSQASFPTMIATAVTAIVAGGTAPDIAAVSVAGMPPGLWQGYASDGKYTSALVLDDGTAWFASGTAQNGGVAAPSGFLAGITSQQGAGQLAGSLYDYGDGAAAALGGSYSSTAFDATLTEPGNALTASLTPAPANLYSYDAQADLSAISGYWAFSSSDGTAGAISISATGGATAVQSSCTLSGTLLPRASGKNVFNVSGAWSGASCAKSGHVVTGVAISHALTNGQNELLLGLLDLTNGSGVGAAAIR